MNTKMIACLFAATLLSAASFAKAQQSGTIPRIGFLVSSTPANYVTRIETFRQGLRELGYIEGKNINIEYRYAEGKEDRMREIVAEFVSQKVDLIVTAANATAAKNATKTIPIVFAAIADPVASGIIDSLAKPGGNLTGLTVLAPELTGKRLELLKEAAPKITRVAFLWNPSNRGDQDLFREAQAASQILGLQLLSLEVTSINDFDNVFATATKERVNALTMTLNPLINTYRPKILDFVAKNRMPAIYGVPDIVEGGGLMSYGPDYAEHFRRLATYVDKVLKGAKPADLPVEQPTKFEFVINLKTAKQISLTIPPNLLARASKVIK
jgi:putative ABC transport system substrate-binding protein